MIAERNARHDYGTGSPECRTRMAWILEVDLANGYPIG